jgi:hypothetical protein
MSDQSSGNERPEIREIEDQASRLRDSAKVLDAFAWVYGFMGISMEVAAVTSDSNNKLYGIIGAYTILATGGCIHSAREKRQYAEGLERTKKLYE